VDKILPVDVYISGCPPRPEAILEALLTLRKKLDTQQPARTFFKKEEPREANAPVPGQPGMGPGLGFWKRWRGGLGVGGGGGGGFTFTIFSPCFL